MHVDENGKKKHKSLWLVIFWCTFSVIGIIGQIILTQMNSPIEIPLTQIVAFAGAVSTAYISLDKAVKMVRARAEK